MIIVYQDGWTPLHWAASYNLLNVAALLIEKGADMNAVTFVCTAN